MGQQIRQIRQQKGIRLNEFANEIGVSPAYLSNLETGKTQTIQFEVLSKLQKEHKLNIDESDSEADPLVWRVVRISEMLLELSSKNPIAADYFMKMVEEGSELFNNNSSNIH
ncbi:helix-turn-helix domain-containing protein [Paenibacillus illinoisensis]|uniref:helix-turn-helix domain-containing protein n=1 Tax=Paenibacillus illinoisensis TaxID=59845 RepID=UPI001FE26705|nr:helix-turn-helix transcriptional regulator [Paenibacillus illinoisensis]